MLQLSSSSEGSFKLFVTAFSTFLSPGKVNKESKKNDINKIIKDFKHFR